MDCVCPRLRQLHVEVMAEHLGQTLRCTPLKLQLHVYPPWNKTKIVHLPFSVKSQFPVCGKQKFTDPDSVEFVKRPRSATRQPLWMRRSVPSGNWPTLVPFWDTGKVLCSQPHVFIVAKHGRFWKNVSTVILRFKKYEKHSQGDPYQIGSFVKFLYYNTLALQASTL